MASDLTPYNFTISDQSPLFQYLPFRDGPTQSSWNVTYAGDADSAWVPNAFIGAGPSSHRTAFVGASVQLDWIGTAVYLYGEGPPNGFTIEVDGTQANQVSSFLSAPGLLFTQSNLSYGPHSLVLRVVQPEVSISNATITVGMGDAGTTIQNRTIETTTVPITAPGFTLSAGWISQTYPYANTNAIIPRIATHTQGSSLSFPLTSANTFYILGGVNYNHGLFSITLTPPSNLGSQQAGQYNGSSRWIGLNTILYLATGLNRSQTYQVEMTNTGGQWLDLSSVVILDTPSKGNTPTPSQSGESSHGSSKHPGTGVIAGIVVVAAFILLTFVALLFYCQRRRQRGTDDAFMIEHEPRFVSEALSTSYNVTPFGQTDQSPSAQAGDAPALVWAEDLGEKISGAQRGSSSSAPSTSPLNINSTGARTSGLTADQYKHKDQPQILHASGSMSSKPSQSTNLRPTSISDRSLVAEVPVVQNMQTTMSPLVGREPTLDTPPAYSSVWEDNHGS